MIILALFTILIFCTGILFATVINYGNVTLTGGYQAGNFYEAWDLTAGDLVISFTYDANGLVDDFGGSAHAWSQLGIREVGYGNFNPTWDVEGAGVWFTSDYDWTVDTFDPDPPGSPILDLDDKMILQKAGGHGESDYNLPSPPPNPGANHRVWFDRDSVDQWQAQNPLAVDGGTYNTNGIYDIVITLHATGPTSGTAYMSINGLDQGFETDGDWTTMELTPAGMTFTGDMSKMQVFYGLYGYGATHSVTFNNITVEGTLESVPPTCQLVSYDPGPPQVIYIGEVKDSESGLASITVVQSTNLTISWTSFTPGTTDPVTVTLTKIDNNQPGWVVLEVTDMAGNSIMCDPVYTTLSNIAPERFELLQNYPNPFNPTTTIHFKVAPTINNTANVSLKIYDLSGREVKTLVNEPMQPGEYAVEWDGTNNSGEAVAGGVYIYRMVAGKFAATRKMILMK